MMETGAYVALGLAGFTFVAVILAAYLKDKYGSDDEV